MCSQRQGHDLYQATHAVYEHYFAGGFSTITASGSAKPRLRALSASSSARVQRAGFGRIHVPDHVNDMVRGVVFCDTGASGQYAIDNWQDRYRVRPGFGLRITIPAMGPAPIAARLRLPIVTEGLATASRSSRSSSVSCGSGPFPPLIDRGWSAVIHHRFPLGHSVLKPPRVRRRSVAAVEGKRRSVAALKFGPSPLLRPGKWSGNFFGRMLMSHFPRS